MKSQIRPGIWVFHHKMQILAKVERLFFEDKDWKVAVVLAENFPLQTWNLEDVSLWEPEKKVAKLEMD